MNRIFLLTANVGSVFENIDVGLPIWINELTTKVQSDNLDFLALHFQETGGKYYKNGSKVIQNFFSLLVESLTVIGYNLIEGIIDSDSGVDHQFTALSNVYFIRKNCSTSVQIWDFENSSFVSINSLYPGKLFVGKEFTISRRNQKEKFPQHFFPNCKWSRKGFARTRWRFSGTTFDLVNIHLFHDSSNLIAASTFPSPFSQNRQRVLNFILDKFHNDDLEKVPMFIFGDFNFRVNTFDIFEILRKETIEEELCNTSKDGIVESNTNSSDLVIDAKHFSVFNHEQRFKDDWRWLRAYDFESSHFETLTELDVQFHPSYPFDESDPHKFMRTRCPSWCDRVLFTHDSKSLISNESVAEYNLIGADVCMGDHKPVYLSFTLKSEESSNAESPSEPNYRFESGSSEPGIPVVLDSITPKSKSRFVSFFRGNLSFHHEPSSRSRVTKTPSLAPSVGSTTTAISSKKKCCFLKIRNSGGLESQGLTNGVKGRGKQNILISNEIQSTPLGFDGDKRIMSISALPEPRKQKVKESSNDSKETRRENRNGSSLAASGCCPACSIL